MFLSRAHPPREKRVFQQQKNTTMSCNLDNARRQYRAKVAAHKARKAGDKSKTYQPKPKPKTCRYCKKDGHVVGYFNKDIGRFITTCQAAIDSNKRKSAYKKQKRTNVAKWQNDISNDVEAETDLTGWNTIGSSNKVKTSVESKASICTHKNAFDGLNDESDESDDAPIEAPAAAAAVSPAGAWAVGAPRIREAIPEIPALVREPEAKTPPNSDSENELPHIESAPDEWGDDE